VQDIGRPGIEQAAVDLVPGPALPGAESRSPAAAHRSRLRVQGLGQAACAPQGAGNHRRLGGQQRPQTLGDRLWIFGFDVELAIADAGGQQRARVADQEKLHSSPQ
jgi:hypothetical protein